MNVFFALPSPVGTIVFVGLVIALALCCYAAARWAFGRRTDDDTRDLAGSVLFRIAALHGLVLALVFAQELSGIRDVSTAAAHEAAMLADIYYDAERYGTEEMAPVRRSLARYGRIVAEEEWAALGRQGRLLEGAWDEWETAYEALLDAAPSTRRQERLLDIMLGDIRALSELREDRENAVRGGGSQLFFIAAVTGIVLISAAYFTWAPTLLNLTLISSFAGYTGLIIYFVVAYANPYTSPGAAIPTGFERFLTEDVRRIAE